MLSCMLCYQGPHRVGRIVQVNPCEHLFCRGCITAYIEEEESTSCPVCDHEILDNDTTMYSAHVICSGVKRPTTEWTPVYVDDWLDELVDSDMILRWKTYWMWLLNRKQ